MKRDKGIPKKFSFKNSMIPSPVPKELQGLTQFEKMLIAITFPIIHVYTKPRGGQRAYKGHFITVPQNVQQLADVLPRCAEEIPVIVFTYHGKDNQSKDFTVRRKKVDDALHWLVANNPLYKNIIIDINRLQALPENGTIHDSKKIEVCNKGDKHDEHDPDLDYSENNHEFHHDIDRGPIDPNTDDLVYDEEAEMSSFLPVNKNHLKEKDIIKNELFRQDVKHEWKEEDSPLNEFKTEFLATMSFPTLFPEGKGDPTNYSTVRNISDSDTEAFTLKLKHLIRFGERINGKWVFRFASHPRFAYWAYNILYRKRVLNQGNFFVKQNPGEANLTTSDLQELWHSNTYSSLTGKLMHYAKNITGTNACILGQN